MFFTLIRPELEFIWDAMVKNIKIGDIMTPFRIKEWSKQAKHEKGAPIALSRFIDFWYCTFLIMINI